jgi:hypothetical protein
MNIIGSNVAKNHRRVRRWIAPGPSSNSQALQISGVFRLSDLADLNHAGSASRAMCSTLATP